MSAGERRCQKFSVEDFPLGFSCLQIWRWIGAVHVLTSRCYKAMFVLSHFSRVWLFATLWTVAHQAPLSVGFSRQDYWSGLPCRSPGAVPDPEIKPSCLLHWQAGSLPLVPPGNPTKQCSSDQNQACPLCISYLIQLNIQGQPIFI